MTPEPLTGAERCWPCTIANGVVGLLVALVPLAAVLASGNRAGIPWAVAWGVLVIGVTIYRLVSLGYLPFAEPAARFLGLHDRIGPGADEEDGGNPE